MELWRVFERGEGEESSGVMTGAGVGGDGEAEGWAVMGWSVGLWRWCMVHVFELCPCVMWRLCCV